MTRGPTSVPSWRWTAGWAIALLVALGVLGWWLELGVPRETVLDAQLPLPGPASSSVTSPDAADETEPGIVITPAFTLDGPTTLELTLSRTDEPGWVGVSAALVSEEDQLVRELALDTLVTPRADGPGTRGTTEARAVFDELPTGAYRLRVEAGYDGPATPGEPGSTPTPRARLRAVAGARSPATLLAALGLLVLPPVASGGRALWRRLARSKAPAPTTTAVVSSDPPSEQPTRA